MRILVTGATGFLGKALCLSLIKEGYEVRGTYRTSYPQDIEFQKVDWVKIPGLLPTDIWDKHLEDCNVVIHAAARVHQMRATKQDEEEFYKDNVLGTKAIAEAVLRNGKIRQFIFISTIGVYGNNQKMPINENTHPISKTIYGKSKLDAENILQDLLKNSPVFWTIFRPVVMYGKDNVGNISTLEKFIKKGIPIPVKNLNNKRSFLSVQNMNIFINSSILNNKAQNKIFCLADPHPISTENLVLHLGQSINTKAVTFWLPVFFQYILAFVGSILKKSGIPFPWNIDVFSKISTDFWVDMHDCIMELDVTNLLTTEASLKNKNNSNKRTIGKIYK